jgi:two-component system, chemotaxis family, CheB/CheR fusion protein
MGKNDIIVIGIGASAGGLEALQAFIQNLPASSNMAYIIAQHLSPTYKSLVIEL